ncbi:MAG: toll/interleukin-1 receptor domain-containing protein [Anaerolineales bacterium]|nr:toll/interleukin-1 receptor domain-containing protein [Anaerolineales bacterium]
MSDVYLFYAPDDAPRVEGLRRELNAVGLKPFMVGHYARSRETWSDSILFKMQEARFIIIVITRNAEKFQPLRAWWDEADKQSLPIFTLLLEEAPNLRSRYMKHVMLTMTTLPAFLRALRPVPLPSVGEDTEDGLLLDDVLVAKESAAPPTPEPVREKLGSKPAGKPVTKPLTTPTPKKAPQEPPAETPPPPQALPAASKDEEEQRKSDSPRRTWKPDRDNEKTQPLPPMRGITPPEQPKPPAPPASPAPPAPIAAAPVGGVSAGEGAPGGTDDLRGGGVSTEDVRFTGFAPRQAAVDEWYSLLVYTHIDAALDKVRRDADRFKAEMGGNPREAKASPPAKLARGTEISIVPACEGVIFNPERVTFKWAEDMHRADFRFRARTDMADLAGNIIVSIFVGALIVGTIKLGILFTEADAAPPPQEVQPTAISASLYSASQIFPSYSHKDEGIVLACRNAYKALGYDFLRDKDALRPGEDWNAKLVEFIEKADIFQLFWSPRSAQSKYCQEEWQYALKLMQARKKPAAFIRPVYWERDTFVAPPPELGSLHFAFVDLPKTTP